jgi:hypothetical protein
MEKFLKDRERKNGHDGMNLLIGTVFDKQSLIYPGFTGIATRIKKGKNLYLFLIQSL